MKFKAVVGLRGIGIYRATMWKYFAEGLPLTDVCNELPICLDLFHELHENQMQRSEAKSCPHGVLNEAQQSEARAKLRRPSGKPHKAQPARDVIGLLLVKIPSLGFCKLGGSPGAK